MSPEGHFSGWIMLLWYRGISLGLHLDRFQQSAPNQMSGVCQRVEFDLELEGQLPIAKLTRHSQITASLGKGAGQGNNCQTGNAKCSTKHTVV